MTPGPDAGATGVLIESSHEPKDEYVPARVAVRSKTLRGRAYWRGLASAPAAFMLLFALVGVGLAALGVWGRFVASPERAAEMADPEFYLVAIAFGVVFVLVPVQMLRVLLTSVARTRQFAARAAGEGPFWARDHDWKTGGMGPDYEEMGASTFGTLTVILLIALFNIALAGGPLGLKILVLLFDAFGLLLVYNWVSKVVNRARFRRPTIVWHTLPAHPGGLVAATVRFAVPLTVTGPARATLRCVRDVPGEPSRDAGAVALQPTSSFREVREFACSSPLTSLDLRFQGAGRPSWHEPRMRGGGVLAGRAAGASQRSRLRGRLPGAGLRVTVLSCRRTGRGPDGTGRGNTGRESPSLRPRPTGAAPPPGSGTGCTA